MNATVKYIVTIFCLTMLAILFTAVSIGFYSQPGGTSQSGVFAALGFLFTVGVAAYAIVYGKPNS